MITSLPLFHSVAGQPVIVLGEGEAAEAKRRLVERAGGVVVGEAAAARIAFVALDAPEEVVARLRNRGIFVNVVDRPDLCDFTVPSILDRSPVLLAIGTGGASAGLAKALRLRLELLLPQSLGLLATKLGGARAALRERFADQGERRRALDAALAAGGTLDPLDGRSAEAVDDWLAGVRGEAGSVVEIHLRSHDPEDLTLREARLLGSADMLAHEAGVPAAILDRARADARRMIVAPGEAAAGAGLVIVVRRN